MGLGLSTAWNAFRCTSGKKIIKEIKGLGFREVELSFNLTREIIGDIAQLVEKKQIKVNSLHNYCPIPDGLERKEALPDCYSVASLDEAKRALAVKFTKVTIDTAHALNAQAVVLHCGRVEVADRTRELIAYYDNNALGSEGSRAVLESMFLERQEKAEAHFAAAVKSLEDLSCYARKYAVDLGIETRYYFREIPSFAEIGRMLEIFKGTNVFYWHDTGHAQLWENLGLLKHKEYLESYGSCLRGMHIHDIRGADDHRAPLRGDLDFSLFKKYLHPGVIKTLEAQYPASAGDIMKAKDFLEKLYGDC